MSGIFDQVINYSPPSLLKGTVTYKGTWSAATNTPTLVNPTDSTTNGHYYVVSAGGTQFSLVFNIGDWIISNGSAWEKVDNTDAVSSVFGRTGAVVGVSTDYSSVGITATAVGASSPSTGAFTTLSATTPLAATSGGTGLSSLGTGVATFLGTPTSANLAAAVTNETGSGSLVFGTSPTITTPVIAQINDANGNETLKLASIASAVNEVTIENAATGNAVHISATGGDASVGLHLAGKGASGYVNVQDSTDATKRIMFNAAGGTTNTRTMLSSTQTVDRTLSLPDATDTLVGRATTDTLTNKTLTSPTITGGALNGTLGATTPSSVAATTGGFSGVLDVGAGGFTQGGYGLLNINGSSGGMVKFGTATVLKGSIYGNVGGITYDAVGALVHNFYTNSVSRGTITDTGLNGMAIGATTPSTVAATTLTTSSTIVNSQGSFDALTFTGSSSNSMGFRIQNAYTGANNWNVFVSGGAPAAVGSFGIYDDTGGVTRMTIAKTTGSTTFSGGLNSTAIGATTPSTGAFTTAGIGAAATSGTLHVTSSGGAFGDYQLALTRTSVGTTTLRVGGSNELIIAPNGTDRASFTTSGAAITGTLSATGNATIAGTLKINASGSGTDIQNATTTAASMGLYGGNTYNAGAAINVYGSTHATLANVTTFSNGAFTERMRIDSSGNVGIGTTSPSSKLDILDAASANQTALTARAQNSTTYSSSVLTVICDRGTTNSSYNLINANNNVISGQFLVRDSGNVVNTNNSYGAISDIRFKENIVDATPKLEKLNQVRIVNFNRIGNEQKQIGVIAQELEQIFPSMIDEATDRDADGNDLGTTTKSVKYSVFVPMLIKAVQELTARLAALESK